MPQRSRGSILRGSSCTLAPSVPASCRRGTTWASVLQAEFLKGLCLEKIELELGQRFRRQCLNLLPDLGRQRAELCFHLPQSRPPLALHNAAFDAAFVSGLHEGFDLLIRLG